MQDRPPTKRAIDSLKRERRELKQARRAARKRAKAGGSHEVQR